MIKIKIGPVCLVLSFEQFVQVYTDSYVYYDKGVQEV